MDVKFDKFGMKYGWLGKRGMMLVRENSLVPNEYDEFIDFCIGYQKEFEKVSLKGVTSKAIALSIAVSLIPVVGPIVGMTGLGAMSSLKIFNNQKKLLDQQYQALTTILYLDGLSEFMEG